MRKFLSSVVSCLFVASVLFPLAGCIAHAPGNGGGGTQQKIVVTVASSLTAPFDLPVSTTQSASTATYQATVTGNSDTSVTWSLVAGSGCSLSGSDLGSLSPNGNTVTYTAPTAPPTILPVSPCQVAVTATANADGATNSAAPANVQVAVSIDPATDNIGQGANRQYTATVIGAPSSSQNIAWSVTCPLCPTGQAGGIFDGNNFGLYVAPGLQQGTTGATVTIVATPNFDPSAPGKATMNVVQTDPLGPTPTNVQTLPASQCPADSNGGLMNGTCYSMTVSCDGIADVTAYLKVNTPAAPVGTVLFLIGGGGNGLYDSAWANGYQTVENVFNANYNTVQVSFGAPFTSNQPNGWLQGPGGVRRLACRYATVADWVYNNPKMINASSSAANSAPMCATGNSGGSGALAYAVFEYGLAGTSATGPTQEFTMIEPTSGPVMTRLDAACVCNNNLDGPAGPCTGEKSPTPLCFSPSEADIIDPAYQIQGQSNQPTLCSNGLSGVDATNANRFASDSIDYAPNNTLPIPLSKTLVVNMRFGGGDTTTAVPQGEYWWTAVRPQPIKPACTQSATHEIPDDPIGAAAIATDIIGGCVLPPAAKAVKK